MTEAQKVLNQLFSLRQNLGQPEPEVKELASMIAALMDFAGMDIIDLGRKSGVSVRFIVSLLHGFCPLTGLSKDSISKIAAALDVDGEHLLTAAGLNPKQISD